jgi:biopolymer transport protein ExbB
MSDFALNLIVQGTLYALVFFSVLTWAVILTKGVQNWRAARQNKAFDKQFWSAPTLEAAAAFAGDDSPKARLAKAGFLALTQNPEDADDLEHSWDRQELLERHLHQQIQRERHKVESGLALLASIGSTAPFVGLFGTVFGIIHALASISKNASASIDVVAGPIGEALVATGIGIAVAVPAVLAYNFFVRRLKVLSADYDSYATDLVNLSQKRGFRVLQAGARVSAIKDAKGLQHKKEVFA